MISYKGIPIGDIVSMLIGMVGAVATLLASKGKLPKDAQTWLAKLGTDSVMSAIAKAEAFAEMTPDQKRVQAVTLVQKLASDKLGVPLPTSIANLIVEFVYQQWKKRVR